MSWGRIDDKFHSHRKVVAVAKKTDALGAWVRMMSWCCDQRSNGTVPRVVALSFATQGTIDRLVDVALLDREGDDYFVHDFAKYNRGEDVSDKRREAGKKGAAARWAEQPKTDTDDGKPDGNCHPLEMASAIGDGWQTDASRVGARARPDPDPDPVPRETPPTPPTLRRIDPLPPDHPVAVAVVRAGVFAEENPLQIAGSASALMARSKRPAEETAEALEFAIDATITALGAPNGIAGGKLAMYLGTALRGLLAPGGLEAARAKRDPKSDNGGDNDDPWENLPSRQRSAS